MNSDSFFPLKEQTEKSSCTPKWATANQVNAEL